MFERIKSLFREKDNPAQSDIALDEGIKSPSTKIATVRDAYNKIEVVNRGVNIIVDCFSSVEIDVKDRIPALAATERDTRPNKINSLLNFKPNPYQDISSFRRIICMDMLIEGNAFVYFDGTYLFNLPAKDVEIIPDPKTYVKAYKFGKIEFLPNEIIHIRENSSKSIYRGTSRIESALSTINALSSLIAYQQNFLDKGTIPGIVLKNKNHLSDKVKRRTKGQWKSQYNVKDNAKAPIVLDGEWDIQFLGASTIKELDFEASVEVLENKILEALGVPQVLLKSGNNANVTPNVRLFYHLTVLPIADRVSYAFERYFGHDLKNITADVPALRPDLREEGAYWTTMVNSAILTRNEARERLRYEKSTDPIADTLILPANVAGSAQDPNQGGRPSENTN